MSRLRRIAAPFVVAPPTGARIRTRLHVSTADDEVLARLGEHLGRLAGSDLSWRCSLGDATGADQQRTDRKQSLTAASTSRWAGAITRTSNDQWTRGYQNLFEERAGLRRAIAIIGRRLAAPAGGTAGKVRGYATRAERWNKQCRRQALTARLTRVQARIDQARVSVVRGGRRLVKARHNLDVAGLSDQQWRQRWHAARWFICADGEADKGWGNETIRVHPEAGWCEIRLPAPLAGLANQPHCRYRLACPVAFTHRGDEWAAQAATGAVRYDLDFDPDRQRWYLDASWTIRRREPARLDELCQHRTLAVDLNADHLACWVVDPSGNPVGPPYTIPLHLDDLPASTRDGRLRAAISTVIELAHRHDCRSISIEDLGFHDARHTGRETMGRGRRGRRFRRTVAAIPTARFRNRLVAMAHNRGLAVIAVDPAYTSRWGAQHWQTPLHQQTSPTTTVTRHHAAAVVIGRRSHRHRGRRRPGVPRPPHQRMGPGKLPARPTTYPQAARNPDTYQAARQTTHRRKTCPAEQDQPGDQATQHRSGSPITTPSATADKR